MTPSECAIGRRVLAGLPRCSLVLGVQPCVAMLIGCRCSADHGPAGPGRVKGAEKDHLKQKGGAWGANEDSMSRAGKKLEIKLENMEWNGMNNSEGGVRVL